MTPKELYQSGKLDEAVESALEKVRSQPGDHGARYFLAELLCLNGDLERADNQFNTLSKQWMDAAINISLVRHLIRAETARREFRDAGRVPEFVNNEASDLMQAHLRASIAVREGNSAEAMQILTESEQQRPHCAGTCDGKAFSDFRDCDDLTASFLEVLTGTGKYYWIPIDRIQSIDLEAPERPLDLLWRKARMTVSDGPDGEVYLPSLYLDTNHECDNQLKLGRGTDWQGGDGSPMRGRGLRMLLIGDEARSILEISNIEFDSE